MEKVVRKYRLGEEPSIKSYWLTKSVEERFEALEQLIRPNKTSFKNEITDRLQRVYRVIKKTQR